MQKPFTIIFSKAPKNACIHTDKTAYYHLPGLFEFYELYRIFLPLFREHREYFYDWCEIGSIYGARRTACGVADVLDMVIVIRRMFGN